MTPSLLIRPVLAILLTAGLGACGMVEADPHRFENLANRIASVPLDGSAPVSRAVEAPVRTAAQSGLRPALRVEVMDPHALWDARDGGLDGVVRAAAPQVAEAVAPVVIQAAVRETSARVESAARGLRPAVGSRPAGLVQLGAYSSETAARAAWTRLKSGSAAWALEGLTPTFEAVQVNGRDLVRLKVRAPAAGAAAVCAAAGVDDPWCRRPA